MKPGNLQASSFASYPAEGRALAIEDLAILRAMPLSLLPSYLVQIEEYDTLFPIEQERLRTQLRAMSEHGELIRAFDSIRLTAQLEQADWLRHPKQFLGALAAELWQTQQIDAYHKAAEALFAALPAVPAAQESATRPPLLIAVFGSGAKSSEYPLFMRLRASGFYARNVDEIGAAKALCGLVEKRAQGASAPYRHWYMDGGEPWEIAGQSAEIHHFSFRQFAPVTVALFRQMATAVQEGWGPELLAERLRELSPEALRMEQVTRDRRIGGFFCSVLTQGSGTQLYSTSFVQAAAVELVRRAQPDTLLVRFAPRRKAASINDMLEQRGESVETDPEGSLVDADMGLYYAWLAMQKGTNGSRASLLAYVEGRREAFLVGPRVTRGVESRTLFTLSQLSGMLEGI